MVLRLALNQAGTGNSLQEESDLFAEEMKNQPLETFAHNLLENLLFNLAENRPGLLGPMTEG